MFSNHTFLRELLSQFPVQAASTFKSYPYSFLTESNQGSKTWIDIADQRLIQVRYIHQGHRKPWVAFVSDLLLLSFVYCIAGQDRVIQRGFCHLNNILTNKMVNDDVQEPRPCHFDRCNICNEEGNQVQRKH